MPKMTAKYKAALAAAKLAGISPYSPASFEIKPQDQLYTELAAAGYFWDSGDSAFNFSDPANADPPSVVVRHRVMAAADRVEQEAADTIRDKSARGYTLVDKSKAYPCRPPQQLDSRIYLTFMPPASAQPASTE